MPNAPQVFRDKRAMRAWSRARRCAGEAIALVPTMGFLHDGHLSLVREAHKHADRVVVSIYVNPTQFAPGEDFDVYPRDEAGDLAKLSGVGVDAVFAPADLYSESRAASVAGHETFVTATALQRPLCGKSRPTFFRGVATVVTKLFNIVEPDAALFGKKDYQQLLIVQRIVRDLDLPVRVVGQPIVREPDGLAMSSRNARLVGEDARSRALGVPASLDAIAAMLAGGQRETDALLAAGREALERAGARLDYLELVDRETLEPIPRVDRPALAAVAAWVDDVRLIDNREL